MTAISIEAATHLLSIMKHAHADIAAIFLDDESKEKSYDAAFSRQRHSDDDNRTPWRRAIRRRQLASREQRFPAITSCNLRWMHVQRRHRR